MTNSIEISLVQHSASSVTLPAHPLQTQEILEIIMCYLSHQDVASFARAHIAEAYRLQDITYLIRKLNNTASVFSAAAKVFQIWNRAKPLYEARLLFFRDNQAVRERLKEYYGDKYSSSSTPLTLSLQETPLPEIEAVGCIVKLFYKENSFRNLEELFPLDVLTNEDEDVDKCFHNTVFSYVSQSQDQALIQAFTQSDWFTKYCSHFEDEKIFVALVQNKHLALAQACLHLSRGSLEDVINDSMEWDLIRQSSEAIAAEYDDVAQPILDAMSDFIKENALEICEQGYWNIFRDDISYYLVELDEEEVGEVLALTVQHDEQELFDELISGINSGLIKASRETTTETLEEAFNKGFLQEEDNLGKALELFSSFGLTEVVRILVCSPYIPFLTQGERFDPVYAAIKYGHESVAQVLLQSNLIGDDQITPLLEKSFYRFTVEEDDSSDEREKVGITDSDTIYNDSYGSSTLMIILLSVSRAKSIDFSCIGSSQLGEILMVLAWHGKLACIEALVSSPGFMEGVSPKDFGIAIVRAAEENHFEVVRHLVNSCTFLDNILTDLGLALDLAALYGYEDIVRFFITSPYFHLIPLENLSIHHIAAVGNSLIVEMFVLWPWCEKIKLKKFMQAIVLSARNRHLDCLKILLKSPRFKNLAHDEEDTTRELVASTVMKALNFCIWEEDFRKLIESLDGFEQPLYSLPKLVCEEHANIVEYQIRNHVHIDMSAYREAISEAIRKRNFEILGILTASTHFNTLSESTLLSFVPFLSEYKINASATIEAIGHLALESDYTHLIKAMLDAGILSSQYDKEEAENPSKRARLENN